MLCAAATTAGAWPGSDNDTVPAHPNPAWKSGQHNLEVCVQQENNPTCNEHSQWLNMHYGSSLLLQDHFGSRVFLTLVTLQFIQLLKTKLEIIPFKHPTGYLCLEQSPQAITDAKWDFQARTNYSLQIWWPRTVSITETHSVADGINRWCQEGVTQWSLL